MNIRNLGLDSIELMLKRVSLRIVKAFYVFVCVREEWLLAYATVKINCRRLSELGVRLTMYSIDLF
jgi:hypothetical protein